MAKQDQIRTQLDNKVFTPYGKTAIVYSYTESTDDYGSPVRSYGSGVTTTIVDYDIMYERQSYPEFGDLKEGDREAVFRYDVSLDADYLVGIAGEYFKIIEIERPSLPDVIVQIVRLAKTNDTLSVST